MSDPSAGPEDLFRQLVSVFAEQLNRFQSDEPAGDEEKRARALAVLAKTLESITAMGIKLNVVGAADFDPNTTDSDGLVARSQASDTAQLVSNLVQAVEVE